MDAVNFAPMTNGGFAVFSAMVYVDPDAYQLEAFEPSRLERFAKSNRLRIVLIFADAPAPRSRTVIIGRSGSTITSSP